MKKLLIMLLLLSGMAAMINAQNLSKMSEKERNEKLLREAKEAIKTYAPDYCRYTCGKYTIELVVYNSDEPTEKTVYNVKFTDYNKEEESFGQGYAIAVDFRVEDGCLEALWNGHGIGLRIPKEPLTRGEELPRLKYKRVPPYKQNPNGSWSM